MSGRNLRFGNNFSPRCLKVAKADGRELKDELITVLRVMKVHQVEDFAFPLEVKTAARETKGLELRQDELLELALHEFALACQVQPNETVQ